MKKYIVPKAKVVNLGPMNFLMASNEFVKEPNRHDGQIDTGFGGDTEDGWGE